MPQNSIGQCPLGYFLPHRALTQSESLVKPVSELVVGIEDKSREV